MPTAPPRQLAALLAEFVASHRGLRMGSLFGRPAAYAGRRVFARIVDRDLAVKLPPAGEELVMRSGMIRRTGKNGRGGWLLLRVPDHAARAKLGTVLELAARHAAETGRSTATEELR